MAKFANFLQLVAKQRDRQISSEQVNSLTDTTFESNVFKRNIKILVDSEDISATKTGVNKTVDEFHKFMVRDRSAKRKGHGKLYLKNFTDVFQMPV